jgi:hypothetical protein
MSAKENNTVTAYYFDDEKAKLKKLAKEYDLTMSNLIRWLTGFEISLKEGSPTQVERLAHMRKLGELLGECGRLLGDLAIKPYASSHALSIARVAGKLDIMSVSPVNLKQVDNVVSELLYLADSANGETKTRLTFIFNRLKRGLNK